LQKKSETLRLESVPAGSRTEASGLRPGHRLVSINRHPIRDLIDFHFHAADRPILDCVFQGDAKTIRVRIPREGLESFGLRFAPMRFRGCGNACEFCFVDQNPEGLRETLYFKDEDYRLSFLYGNYVTLTLVDSDDLRRIADQRLSPLYISVHAADAGVRARLLGIRRDDRLFEKIRFLSGHGIQMHAQIVVCPGVNDGSVLADTIRALSGFRPQMRSVAVVPVGLTRHRRGLPRIRSVDGPAASRILGDVRPLQSRFLKETGESFAYCADELYLLSGEALPKAGHYGDYWQMDNGVGMLRAFLGEFRRSRRSFPRSLGRKSGFALVTGTLAGPVMKREVMPFLSAIGNAAFRLVEAPNRFFGKSVTVSGLLTGRDIAAALKRIPRRYTGLVPLNCLNSDGLFLDGWTLELLSRRTEREIRAIDSFDRFWEAG
jgi:putative radical SAM enzyme (TIGR03279 family)